MRVRDVYLLSQTNVYILYSHVLAIGNALCQFFNYAHVPFVLYYKILIQFSDIFVS